MASLHLDNEEEEHRFFDARDCSVSSTSGDEVDGFGLFSSFCYEVWTKTPESVQQRRCKFFHKMGFDLDETISKEDVDRITKCRGAVTSRSDHEFSSSLSASCSTDDFSISHKSDSVIRKTGNSNVANCCKDELGKNNEEKAERKKDSVKKKLLKRFSSMKSIVYNKGASSNFSHVKEAEVQRVKVRHYRKRLKELSALFTGQDICAHKGPILTIEFSSDGRYLATGGEDGIVRVWQVVEDTRLRKIDPSHLDSSCVYLRVNDHSQLAPLVSDKEKLLKIRRSRRRRADSACIILPPVVFQILEKPLHEFHGHSNEILDFSWSKNNCLLSASTDNTVRMWQVGCDNCINIFRHNNYVTCVQFNPVDESRFVSGSIDGKVRIWEISGCQVVGWTDVRDIVTAVCCRPNGQGLIVGSMKGNCRFYTIADDFFQLEAQISLHGKKKAQCKRITGFQFFPQDPDKLMVTCACSRVRILQGINVIGKYKGSRNSGNLLRASFTSDGKHIISTSNDSNVYLWTCMDRFELSRPYRKTMSSWECFSANATVAIPWFGFKTASSNSSQTFTQDETTAHPVPPSSPARFYLGKELVLEPSAKGSATWPEEKIVCPFMRKSDYKFLKTCQSKTGRHAWNMVIVVAGRDGKIRSFNNYGLPVAL